ncbi:MAG: hypothetical protein WC284_12835 [Candidimonas sp.]
MKIHDIDSKEVLMNRNEMIQYYNLDDVWDKFHDKVLSWVNRNEKRTIDKLVDDKSYNLYSRINFFYNHFIPKRSNASVSDFEHAMTVPFKVWRGGDGIYDTKHYEDRKWISFTANERRVQTFSVYQGSYAQNTFMLPKNDTYWIVELTITMKDILLYIDVGNDEEVIVSAGLAKTAKVIKQISV